MQTHKQPGCCIFLSAICFALSCEDEERGAESVNCTAAVIYVEQPRIKLQAACKRWHVKYQVDVFFCFFSVCISARPPEETSAASIFVSFATDYGTI